MTEILEPICIGMIDDDDIPCPFDHDEPDPPSVENSLIGKGSTLARKMSKKAPDGTHLYSKIKDDFKPATVLNPKNDSEHKFHNKKKVVKIEVRDSGSTVEHRYPVSCAAHHLIPAQESLKESPLLAFMCKKGDSEPIKDGSYSDGEVWSDVGYDVNGAQNGVYLPGSYAVGGGRGGMGVWDLVDDGDEDLPEDPADLVPDPKSNLLRGVKLLISDDNRPWQYVKQAMSMCPGQFHDRHVDYSQFVQSVLGKIHHDLVNAVINSYLNEECDKCKERAKKFEEHGIPTPYGLVTRLNKVSDRFKTFVNGTAWRMNVFTSKWARSYMEQAKAGNKAARL